MGLFCWIVVVSAFALILLHGLAPTAFNVDEYSILMLLIMSIPCFARYLKSAKIPGAQFDFRDNIARLEATVEASEAKHHEVEPAEVSTGKFETFDLRSARNLVDSDPVLALAALRIEIERTLRIAANVMRLEVGPYAALGRIIRSLTEARHLLPEDMAVLKEVIAVCNNAIHGADVSSNEATEVIGIVDRFNSYVPLGYSLKFEPDWDFHERGQLCEWEHCIERMPRSSQETPKACSVFGHDCPGGHDRVSRCDLTVDDIKHRLSK